MVPCDGESDTRQINGVPFRMGLIILYPFVDWGGRVSTTLVYMFVSYIFSHWPAEWSDHTRERPWEGGGVQYQSILQIAQKPTWTWCLHCQIKINFSHQLAIKAQHAVVSNYALVPPPVSDLLCSSWHCWCYALVNPLFFSLEKAFFNLFIMFCPYYLYGNRRHNK